MLGPSPPDQDGGTAKRRQGENEGTEQALAAFEVGWSVASICQCADGAGIYVSALDGDIRARPFLSLLACS